MLTLFGGTPLLLGVIAATVMADMLTSAYFSEEMIAYPDHTMAWFWIGVMAMLSPAGMIIFRKTFNQSEKMAEEEAKSVAAAEEAEAAADAANQDKG